MQPNGIRLGGFQVHPQEAVFPWNRWHVATRVADGQSGFLMQFTVQELTTVVRANLRLHLRANSAQLQTLQLESLGDQALLFAALPPGRCLDDHLPPGRSLPPSQVCRLGIAVAESLSALHQQGAVHGAVRGDRIWIANDGQVILMRDPALRTAEQGRPASTDWLQSRQTAFQYAAPEFVSAQQPCTVATDIYSLGCVLYRLRAGRTLLESGGGSVETWQQSVVAHAMTVPSELAAAVKSQAGGDPLLRVIAHAVAKQPSARFDSAASLDVALKAALPLASDQPFAPAGSVGRLDMRRAGQQGIATAIGGTASLTMAATRRQRKKSARGRRSLPTLAAFTAGALLLAIAVAWFFSSPSGTIAHQQSPPIRPIESQPSPKQITGVEPQRSAGKSPAQVPTAATAFRVIADDRLLYLPPLPPPLPPGEPTALAAGSDASVVATARPEASASGSQNIADSSGHPRSLPTELQTSNRVSLELLPAGPAAIVSIRPAMLTTPLDGESLQTAFPSELSDLLAALATRSGVSIDAIERCTVALHPGHAGQNSTARIDTSLAIALREPIALGAFVDRLQIRPMRTPSGHTFYARAGEASDEGDSQMEAYGSPHASHDTYFLRVDEAGRVDRYGVASAARINEIADTDGAEITLPRTLQALWNHAHDGSDLVAISTSNFLFADGRQLLQHSVPMAIEPLRQFLLPDISAVLVVAQFDSERLYGEVRLAPGGDTNPVRLVRRWQDQIQGWPGWADRFVRDSQPDSSWLALAERMPSMVRFATDQIRVGVSDDAAVANLYLPQRVVPQFAVGLSLALNTPRGQSAVVVASAADEALTIGQILDRQLSVSFDQESLETAIETVVAEFQPTLPEGTRMPAVKILGGDLRKQGITQNQQIRNFTKSDASLRSVLTDLVLMANPDRTANGPADPKQALIWVVADDPQNPGDKAILVTTRSAAEGKYQLPDEFRLRE
jgi:serine/threonine protein kinase